MERERQRQRWREWTESEMERVIDRQSTHCISQRARGREGGRERARRSERWKERERDGERGHVCTGGVSKT